MIIGISGKINSGKDTVANFIQQLSSLEWKHVKFADKIKDIVCLLLNCTREQLEDRKFKETTLGEEWWYFKGRNGLLIPYTSKSKQNSEDLVKLTPRLLMQLLGTECGRKIIHPNIWVNALMSEYNKGRRIKIMNAYHCLDTTDKWIISDVRFPNEANAIKEKSGILIRVNRNPVGIFNKMQHTIPLQFKEHESETALDDYQNWDYVIDNNHSLNHLKNLVTELLIKENIL